MALVEINRDPTRADLRLFGGLGMPAFLLAGGATAWRATGSATPFAAAVAASVAVAAVGLARPAALRAPFVALQVAFFPVGWAVSHAVLAVVFYVLMTPVGLVRRLLGHDAMGRRFDRSATTHWTKRRAPDTVERYFRPF